MNNPFDPLAFPKSYWQGLGWFVGNNPVFEREHIDAMHRGFLAQATALRQVNPGLADITEQMAAEFHDAAVDALTKRA